MMIGIYGLLFEFSNPGWSCRAWSAGSACCSRCMRFSCCRSTTPGSALISARHRLHGRRAFVPTSGALAIGGVVAFVFGSVILIDTDVPGYEIPLPIIATLAVLSAHSCS